MDYYSYKKIYTGGDMFTLSGADFKGLLQYKDGKVTTVETNELLTPKPTYDTDLLTSRIFRDRTVEELNINLPVIRSECVFGLNETFNYNTLKFKLDNIRKNNVFVYSRSFIASNSLPYSDNITYAGLPTLSSSNFTIYNVNRDNPAVNATAVFSDSINYSALGDVFDTTAQTNYEFKDRFAFFCVTNSSFISITGSSDSLGVAEESTMYESTTANNLEFGEIGGITSNNSTVFISDKGNNTILKYNVSGYLNNDSALRNTRYLLKVLGGEGNIERRSNFNEPTILTCNDEYVAVYDSGNKCIKMFTTDFEYVTTFTILNLKKERRGTETIGAMEFDPDFKSLYVITTSDDGEMFLYRKNVITSKLERVVLDEKLDVTSGEVLKSIAFSTVDSNYWYICTDRKIYKKYKTIPQYEIGYFDENRLFDFVGSSGVIENRWNYQDSKWRDSNFNWNLNLGTSGGSGSGSATQQQKFRGVSMSLGDDGQDKILMFSGNRVYFFNEPTAIAYQKVLKQFNYENYGINGFSLKPDEYIQVPVINSELYKVVYDMLVLKNNLVGRFAGQYTDDILRLGSYNYNIDLSELKGDNVEDFFLHHNEEGILGAINRTLSEIYDIQLKLVNLTSVDVGSVVQRGDRYITNSLCAVSGTPDEPGGPVGPGVPANITINKTASLATVFLVGEYIQYSITVTNPGAEAVNFITVTDTITARENLDDSYNILDTSFSLSPSQTVFATYDYQITSDDVTAGSVVNTASVDFVDGVNSDSVTVINDFVETDLILTKNIINEPAEILEGTILKYKVQVTNTGSTATDLIITDSQQPGIQNIAGELFNGVASLGTGESVITNYEYVVKSSDVGSKVSNTVTLTADPDGPETLITLTKTKETNTAVTVTLPSIKLLVSAAQGGRDTWKIGQGVYGSYNLTNQVQLGTSAKDRLIVVTGSFAHNDAQAVFAKSCNISAGTNYSLNRITPYNNTNDHGAFIFTGVIPAGVNAGAAGGPTGGNVTVNLGWSGAVDATDDYGSTFPEAINVYEITDYTSTAAVGSFIKAGNNGNGNSDIGGNATLGSSISLPQGSVCIAVCRTADYYAANGNPSLILSNNMTVDYTWDQKELAGQVGHILSTTNRSVTINAKNTTSSSLSRTYITAAVFK